MKIKNTTHYRTDDLRKLIQRIALDELDGLQRRRLIVYAQYRTAGRGNGEAFLRDNRIWLYLYKKPEGGALDAQQVAHTIAHEMAHTRGMEHADMKNTRYSYDGDWRAEYAWALEYEIRARDPKPKPDAKTLTYERARKNLANWQTKLKRAQTYIKKYAQQVKRYEARAVAQKGEK